MTNGFFVGRATAYVDWHCPVSKHQWRESLVKFLAELA